MTDIHIQPEITQALRTNRPVVALESALLTTGLPRTPLDQLDHRITPPRDGWRADQPINLALSRLLHRIVREGGAVPAMIAIIDGRLHIGLDDEHLARLAADTGAGKATSGTLAHAMATGLTAGTTVSATLIACRLPGMEPQMNADEPGAQKPRRREGGEAQRGSGTGRSEPPPAIRVLATGGIGGVHRDWTERPDISADLLQLASAPACVVCSGAKSILDIPATLEALQTLGVPVLGYRSDRFAQFVCRMTDAASSFSQARDDLAVPRVDDPAAAADICRTHWAALGNRSAVLLSNPVPDAQAIDPAEFEQWIAEGERAAAEAGVAGPQRTPFLLENLARRSAGRTLAANLALLASNAALAAEVAAAMNSGRASADERA